MMNSNLTALLPPQRYEITRISNYKNMDDLLEYAIKQSRDGIQRFVGVRPFELKALLSVYAKYLLRKLKTVMSLRTKIPL